MRLCSYANLPCLVNMALTGLQKEICFKLFYYIERQNGIPLQATQITLHICGHLVMQHRSGIFHEQLVKFHKPQTNMKYLSEFD